MTKFELDTIYEDGRLMVIARSNDRVIFLKDGTEFFVSWTFEGNGHECAKIPDFKKIIEADDSAVSIPAHKSDIEEWLAIAQKKLGYIQHYGAESDEDERFLLRTIRALKKRLIEKQLEPCPDCGGSMEFETSGMELYYRWFYFKCSKCGHRWCSGILGNSEEKTMQRIEQAIERWNSKKEVA